MGTLTSWNPLGHSRPVTGLLFITATSPFYWLGHFTVTNPPTVYIHTTNSSQPSFIHLSMKMELIVSSEMSASNTQTPGSYPKESDNGLTNFSREQCVIHCIRPQKLKRGKTSFTPKSMKNLRLSSHCLWSWDVILRISGNRYQHFKESTKSIFMVNGYKYYFSRLFALVYHTTWHHITFLPNS
jgi:hypothetical protein